MARRVTSRARKRRQQLEQTALIETLQLDKLRTEFPQGIEQICNLPPLRSKPHLIDDFLLKVGDIIYQSRRRLDSEHINRVLQSIRSSNAAAADIQKVTEGLAKLDIEQLEAVLLIAGEVFPKPFFEKQDLEGFFRLLDDFGALMLTLYAAIRLGTGISDKPRGRGRPSSRYVLPALELIDAWESVTSERLTDDSPVWFLKRVPTPKRLETDVKDRKFDTKQPSTEFVWIALRMIDPKIKDAEVFTAIKRALALRDKWYDFVRRKPPKQFLSQIEAFKRILDT